MAMICAAKKTAHRSVMASPNSKAREPVGERRETRCPTMQSAAAPTLARVGRLPATAHSMKGTMTQ